MKKIFSVLFLIAACMVSKTFAAENEILVCNNGQITLTGSSVTVAKDDAVTIMVVGGDFNWLESVSWENISASDVHYTGRTSVTVNGGYEFDFILENSGLYSAVVGSGNFENPETITIKFINENRNIEAVASFNSVGSEEQLKQLLNRSLAGFGVFTNLYDDCDADKVASILYDSLVNDSSQKTSEEIKALIECAIMAEGFAEKKVDNIDKYSGYIGISDTTLEKYYNSSFANELTQYITTQAPTTVEEYSEALKDGILLCTIAYGDGVGVCKDLLNDYYEYIGVEKSKISDKLCNDILDLPLFSSIENLKSYIDTYKPTTENGNNGGNKGNGGGSGGSGSGSSKNVNFEIKLPIQETKSSKAEEIIYFDDISEVVWAQDAINSLYSNGIISGRGNMKFAPSDNITREEYTKMAVNAFNINAEEGNKTYSDVDKNAWYFEYVRKASNAEIVQGIGDGLFGTGSYITRQDAAVILYRAMQVCDYSIDTPEKGKELKDNSLVSEYAKEAVTLFVEAGVINGDENGYFNPNAFITRAETAVMFNNLLKGVGII